MTNKLIISLAVILVPQACYAVECIVPDNVTRAFNQSEAPGPDLHGACYHLVDFSRLENSAAYFDAIRTGELLNLLLDSVTDPSGVEIRDYNNPTLQIVMPELAMFTFSSDDSENRAWTQRIREEFPEIANGRSLCGNAIGSLVRMVCGDENLDRCDVEQRYLDRCSSSGDFFVLRDCLIVADSYFEHCFGADDSGEEISGVTALAELTRESGNEILARPFCTSFLMRASGLSPFEREEFNDSDVRLATALHCLENRIGEVHSLRFVSWDSEEYVTESSECLLQCRRDSSGQTVSAECKELEDRIIRRVHEDSAVLLPGSRNENACDASVLEHEECQRAESCTAREPAPVGLETVGPRLFSQTMYSGLSVLAELRNIVAKSYNELVEVRRVRGQETGTTVDLISPFRTDRSSVCTVVRVEDFEIWHTCQSATNGSGGPIVQWFHGPTRSVMPEVNPDNERDTLQVAVGINRGGGARSYGAGSHNVGSIATLFDE